MADDKQGSDKIRTLDEVIQRLQELRERYGGDASARIRIDGCETTMRIKSIKRIKSTHRSEELGMTFADDYIILSPEIDVEGLVSREKSMDTISKAFANAKSMCWRMVKGYSEMVKFFKDECKRAKAADRVVSAIRKVHPTMLEIRDTLKSIDDFELAMKKCLGQWTPSAAFMAFDDLPIDPDMTDEEFAKTLTKFFKGTDTLTRLVGYVDLVKKIRAEKQSRVDRIARLEDRIAKEARGSAESQNAKILRTKMERIVDIMTSRENLVKEKFKEHRRKMAALIDEYSEEIFSQHEIEAIIDSPDF